MGQTLRSIAVGMLALAPFSIGCSGNTADAGTDSGPADSGLADSGSAEGGSLDSGPVDGGVITDGDTPDTPHADAATTLTITGVIYGQDAIDRTLDGGGPVLWDGAMPDGAVVTPGGRIIGAAVSLEDLSGAIISSGTTDDLGQYTLMGPTDTNTYLHVSPVAGYVGSIRVELTRGADYTAYDEVLQKTSSFDSVAGYASTTYDPSKGWVSTGFNPVSRTAGGEGADITGSTYEQADVLLASGVIPGNRFPPMCMAGTDAGVCAPADRSNQIFWLNVDPGTIMVTPLDPASGHCMERFGVPHFFVLPNTLTLVNIDCSP